MSDKTVKKIESKVRLRKVRLSFPQLFKPKAVQEGGEPRFSAIFILDKTINADQITALKGAIQEVANDKWPKGVPKGVKVCLHEGVEKDYDGYDEGVMFISTSTTRKPLLVRPDLTEFGPNDVDSLYPGCFVNASIQFWAQDNQFGKRVNAQLVAVQFAGHGDAFGQKAPVAEEEFSLVDEDEEGGASSAASSSLWD